MFDTNNHNCCVPGGGGSDGSASEYDTREVRYTDQEYEDDSSDCEDVVIEVPSLPGNTDHTDNIHILQLINKSE